MQNLFNESVPPYTQDANGKLYNRVKDIFHRQSFTSIEDMSSKLRTYGLIKTRLGLEDYLITIRNYTLRSCLSRLRLSNHKLMIEVGRHQKFQSHQRICQVCKVCRGWSSLFIKLWTLWYNKETILWILYWTENKFSVLHK